MSLIKQQLEYSVQFWASSPRKREGEEASTLTAIVWITSQMLFKSKFIKHVRQISISMI